MGYTLKILPVLLLLVLAVSTGNATLSKIYEPETQTVTVLKNSIPIGYVKLLEAKANGVEFEAIFEIMSKVDIDTDQNYRFKKLFSVGNEVEKIEVYKLGATGYWNKIDFSNVRMTANKVYTIKVKAYRKMELGFQSSDIMPVFAGVELEEFVWWNVNASAKQNVTVENIYGSTLTNFPFLVLVNDTLTNGCNDTAITNQTENGILDFEFEENTCTANTLTHIWTRSPSLANGANTTYKRYYNFTPVNDQSDVGNTWSSDYIYVFHMGNSAGDQPNSAQGAPNLSSVTSHAGGIFGREILVSGSSGTITNGWDSAYFDGDSVTWEAWITPHSVGTYRGLAGFNSAGIDVGLAFTNAGALRYASYDSGESCDVSGGSMSANNTYYVVGMSDGSKCYIWVNGVLVGSDTMLKTGTTATHTIKIGESISGGLAVFNGDIDELRISNVNKSSAYVEMVYANRNGVTHGDAEYPSLLVTINTPTNTTLGGNTITTDVNVTAITGSILACNESLDGTIRSMSPASGINHTSTWTGLNYGSHTYNVTCLHNPTNDRVTQEVLFTTECEYHLNLTFYKNGVQSETNVTMTKANTNINYTLENVSALPNEICLEDIGVGKLSIDFNNNAQHLQFYIYGNEDIYRNVSILDTNVSHWLVDWNPVEVPVIVESDGKLENAQVEVYSVDWSRKYLVSSLVTQQGGEGYLYIPFSLSYDYEVTKDGYYGMFDSRIVSATNFLQRFLLQKVNVTYLHVLPWTNCPSLIQSPTICQIYMNSTTNSNITTANITYTNSEGTTETIGTEVMSQYVDITVNSTLTEYNVSLSANGLQIAFFNIRWVNLTDREIQIELDLSGFSNADRIFFLLITFIIASIIAIASSIIVKGSGVYAFGAVTGIIGLSTGAIGAGLGGVVATAIIIGTLLLIDIGKRVVKG